MSRSLFKKGDIVCLTHEYQQDEGPYNLPAGTEGKFLQYDSNSIVYVSVSDYTIAIPSKELKLVKKL